MINYFTLYKNAIIAGIFSLLVIALFIQSYRINSYKAELASSIAQVSILSNTIDEANKATQKLAEDSAKRAESALEALKAEKVKSGIGNKKISSLKAQIGKFTSCDSAVTNAKSAL